jgi:hypothetical protein
MQYHDFTLSLKRFNFSAIAIFGSGWSLSFGCAYDCAVLPEVALVLMYCFRAGIYVLFGIFLFPRVVGIVTVCKFSTPTTTNSCLEFKFNKYKDW